jgi:hypothetical protein
MEEVLEILMALAALVIPMLFAWVVVNRLATKHPRKQERKLGK